MTYAECADAIKELHGEKWLLGKCSEVTAAFAEQFPELKRVRGFVVLRNGTRRSHWWLVTPDGAIFDPTAAQFDTEYFWHAGIAFYEPFNEAQPEPTGKCHNCADFIYDGHPMFCSEKCADEFTADCLKSRRRL